MHIYRSAKAVITGVFAALTAFGAGCASLPGQAGDNPAESSGAPDIFSANAAPLTSKSLPALPTKDPRALGIGAVLPLQGFNGASGRSMQRGLELAVAEINAAGGVNGQPIQLDVYDSEGDADLGAQALRLLRDRDETVLLVGDAPLAVEQAEQLAQFPQLIGFMCDYVAAMKLTPKNGVRLYLNGDQEARTIERYIVASDVNRAAILGQSDLIGKSNAKYLLFILKGNNGLYTYDDSYSPGENNFTLLAQAMMRVNSGALVLTGSGPEYPKVLAAFDATGWKGLVFGYAGQTGLAPMAASRGLAATAAYPLPEFAANPRSTEAGRVFADAYRAQYGADPDLPAAYAYDNIRALAAAATRATAKESVKIRESFLALGTYTGAAGRYEIKDDGDTEMPLRLFYANGQSAPAPTKSADGPGTLNVPVLSLPGIERSSRQP